MMLNFLRRLCCCIAPSAKVNLEPPIPIAVNHLPSRPSQVISSNMLPFYGSSQRRMSDSFKSVRAEHDLSAVEIAGEGRVQELLKKGQSPIKPTRTLKRYTNDS